MRKRERGRKKKRERETFQSHELLRRDTGNIFNGSHLRRTPSLQRPELRSEVSCLSLPHRESVAHVFRFVAAILSLFFHHGELGVLVFDHAVGFVADLRALCVELCAQLVQLLLQPRDVCMQRTRVVFLLLHSLLVVFSRRTRLVSLALRYCCLGVAHFSGALFVCQVFV